MPRLPMAVAWKPLLEKSSEPPIAFPKHEPIHHMKQDTKAPGAVKKVLIAEDLMMFSDFIRELIESLPGLQVLGSTGDGNMALSLIEEYRPDMVVMDVVLDSLNGTEVISQLHGSAHRPHLLVIPGSLTMSLVNHLIVQGVEGIIEKSESVDELKTAILKVSQGEVYYSRMVANFMRQLIVTGCNDKVFSQLTARERQILKLVAESHSSKAIARVLGVSIKTVETHRARILRKINAHDTAGVTRFAISNQMVSMPKVEFQGDAVHRRSA